VHVYRNPFDNISTIHQKVRGSAVTLAASVDRYFALCDTVSEVRSRVPAEHWLDVQQERFVSDPEGVLAAMCRFLGVDAPAEYRRDCASIVFSSPHRSRHRVPWDAVLVEDVRRRTAAYPHLRAYTFAD
jgi:sulfotransferase family protein